jgi:fatty-acyl-CoA synthase
MQDKPFTAPSHLPIGGLAHVIGDISRPLLPHTLAGLLAETVSRQGDREAEIFVQQDRRFTWTTLGQAVDAFAGGLHRLGLVKGDRVGIWSPNRWEWPSTA